MPNDVMLDTLVKLAAAGTSGICILAIAMTGWVLYKSDRTTSAEKYRTMRFYIGSTVVIAIISAVSGVMNAQANATVLREEREARRQESAQAERVINTKADSLVHIRRDLNSLLGSSVFQTATRQSPTLANQAAGLRKYVGPQTQFVAPQK